jgi:hypothetical protein
VTPPVPSNTRVAHDLLDLRDRVRDLRESLEHPDSIENELAPLRPARVALSSAIDTYAATLEDLFDGLLPDEATRAGVLADHYAAPGDGEPLFPDVP